ncbi:biopolymer transporter ExbD [Chitinispirillales bacterium ANBcel5]|uniref:ExbD/TolR family protein n=1 Tax=Cellulosispirillum alkaliphilum TaxID=3039283 RepID=UPI002A5778DB|nr:biopolymer transporter ExbD [Chitinispirillales bacterium ANBcel5]
MFDDYGLTRKKAATAEVNIGPLLDMVFILLIFFVVTTNFNRETGVDVTKPSSQSAVSLGQKTILVGVSREGTIHVHGRQVTAEGLLSVLNREISQRPDASVVIVGDVGSTLGKTVEIMDICARAGVTNVSVSADKR